MALNLAHQIGSLAGTQIAAEVTTGEQSSSATADVSGVRKVPLTNLRCNAPGEALSPPILTPPLTPRSAANRSAMMSPSLRPDLSAACQAFGTLSPLETAEESSASVAWKEGGKKEEKKGVPVYVMMPLDSVTNVNRKKAMNAMIDVWWGLVEREAPGALTIGVATRSFSRWLRSMALKSRLSCHSISVGATSVTLAPHLLATTRLVVLLF
ncbi:hypothetical protein ERO13_D10G161601v2 [Gossypium hirsutum]|uniref:Beta-amylase 1, chloroplastic n=1 Tax=Gossypium hirsutum TaxID=3635 RepID=A0ABM3AU27_GOSHI|nr:beta-amylase 1, chloroplastic-like [Gossypium hirsutum]KAG4126525.1 hypothetical protein ERO13_D10G161601v2 [Gossypium hirsutum]KAG4126526.1 hypothetical protein ERO13_D10G161601v2 [Gossypium hirsutum]